MIQIVFNFEFHLMYIFVICIYTQNFAERKKSNRNTYQMYANLYNNFKNLKYKFKFLFYLLLSMNVS